MHSLPAHRRLVARDALDVMLRGLAVERFLDDVTVSSRGAAQAQLVELDAELAQELVPPRAARSEIDHRVTHDDRDGR